MMILTNAVSEKTDEGCLKVASSLVKRLKRKDSAIYLVSYERSSALADRHLELNKLLLNHKLINLLRSRNESVLYIPFPAKTVATALRIFVLSLFVPGKLAALLVMKNQMSPLARLLLRLSKAQLLVLSGESERFYKELIPEGRIHYIKTGVDTEKFSPVGHETSKELKAKYGFDPECPVILHVGHLKYGRGIDKLLEIDSMWQVLLVTSTLTSHEQDLELKEKLLARSNVRIFEQYIPNIEEIYQLADVYFFPVKEAGNCIDVPLSCLEAAACGKPVITTDFGEMKEFKGREGFYFLESFDKLHINDTIKAALKIQTNCTRAAVEEYDWERAVKYLTAKH